MFAAVALKRMKRREFITVIGGAATLYPFAAGAQQPAKIRRVGVLINLSENDLEAQRLVTVFRDGLAQLRWVDGRNLRLLQQGSSERELRVDPRERRPQSGFALFQQACGLQGAYIAMHALVISPEFARDGGDRQIRPAAHEADELDPLRRQRCQQLFQALEREMFLVYRLPPLGSLPRLDEAAPGGFQTFHVDANLALPRHSSLLAPYTSSGHGTIVDLTVFIAIASLTARAMPSSSKG